MEKKQFNVVNSPTQPDVPIVPLLVEYKNPAGDEYPVIACNNVKLAEYDWKTDQRISRCTNDQILSVMKTVKDCGYNVNFWRSCNYPAIDILKDYYGIADKL